MGQFQHLLNSDAGRAEYFHGRPRPERGLLLVGEVAFLPGGHLGDVDPPRRPLPAPLELLPGNGEPAPGRSAASGVDPLLGILALLFDGAQQRGQQRQLSPGPLIHPRLDP